MTDNLVKKHSNAILIVGGAEDKVHGKEILHEFWLRSGGVDAIIAIVPSASREPTVIGERYNQIFTAMGASEIHLLDVRDREQGNDGELHAIVERATGVFLTGGDQLRLCGLLSDTPLMNRIIERVRRREITVAGTSAGAAVMGHQMIAGGGSGESPNRSLVDMALGLGIVPEVLVDQHFHNRNRLARLLSAISYHPHLLGIGIDEDTCAMFTHDDTFQVLGKGAVTIVDCRDISYNNQEQVRGSDPLSLHGLHLHILSHGDRYHLVKQQPFPRSI